MADGTKIAGDGRQLPYSGAGQGRRLHMFRPANVGPNVVTINGLCELRARARQATRNFPWSGAALDKYVANSIGTGIQAKQKNGTPEHKAAVKKLWDRWVKVSDPDGVLDFYGQQALVEREVEEVGECFGRLRKRRLSDGLPVPLQVQLLEGEQCPAEMWQTASNGNPIRAGIEYNLIGQRVAYYFYRAHPGDVNATVNMGDLTRVPAEEVLHVYQPERIGQIRGIPRCASTITLEFNIERLNDNVLERQAIANLFALFFETPPDAGDQSLFQPIANGEAPACGADVATQLVGLEPGTAQELPPGWKPTFSTPPTAGADYLPFLRQQLLAIAARRGVPYEVLTGDLNGVSDRALKLILNEFRRVIEQRQWLYTIPQFCQATRNAFFDAGVLAGFIDAPGYADDAEFYTDTLWVPQGWPYSHPVQDVLADVRAVRGGLKSRSSTILSNGDDPEQVDQEIHDDNVRGDALGFTLDTDPRKTSAAGLTQARPAGTQNPSTDVPDPSDPAPEEP